VPLFPTNDFHHNLSCRPSHPCFFLGPVFARQLFKRVVHWFFSRQLPPPWPIPLRNPAFSLEEIPTDETCGLGSKGRGVPLGPFLTIGGTVLTWKHASFAGFSSLLRKGTAPVEVTETQRKFSPGAPSWFFPVFVFTSSLRKFQPLEPHSRLQQFKNLLPRIPHGIPRKA